MIDIRGQLYNDIHDDRLRKAFDYSYTWTETFFNYLHSRIYTNTVFRYSSKKDIIDKYLLSASARFSIGPLRLYHQRLCPGHLRAYPIIMTGDRSRDLIGLPPAPPNYTWHHAENIWYYKGHLCCNMFLVDSYYHVHPHCGGVNEYKWIYAIGYR